MRKISPKNFFGRGVLLAVLFSVGLAGAWFFWYVKSSPGLTEALESSALERIVRYSFTVSNKTNQYLEDATASIYAPVALTSFQRVVDIRSSHPYELISDLLGNQRLDFKFDIPPHATKVVSVTVDLEMYPSPLKIEPVNKLEYLQPGRYIESDDPRLVSIAQHHVEEDALSSVLSISRWVGEHIEYSGYIKDDRGALHAFSTKQGDCTEYAYLFTALARSAGLPSRIVGGFVVNEDQFLQARDFHNWSEVLVDGVWRVADPQNGIDLKQEHAYLVMRIIQIESGLQTDDMSNSHQIAYASAGLDIQMD